MVVIHVIMVTVAVVLVRCSGAGSRRSGDNGYQRASDRGTNKTPVRIILIASF